MDVRTYPFTVPVIIMGF